MLKGTAWERVSSALSARGRLVLLAACAFAALALGQLGLPYSNLDWIAYSQAYPTPEPGTEVVVLDTVADTTLDQAMSDDKQGELDAIWVGQAISEQAAARRGLLAFDLTSLPPGATIAEASLELYLGFATELPETQIAVRPVLEDWVESEVTWDTAPEAGPQATSAAVGSENRYYTWDITPLARDWYSGAAPNYGVLLQDLDETTAALRGFTSRESDVNPPRLVINYTPPTPTPTSSPTQTATPTATVTLTPTQPATPTATITLTPSPTASATPSAATCDPEDPADACAATITVRAFVDHRCDGAFIRGVDRPIVGAAITVTLPDGTEQTASTNTDGFATFVGLAMPAGASVTVSATYPAEGPGGLPVVACAGSRQTVTFTAADFKFNQFKYVEFRAQAAAFDIPGE
jgi:hypothetical protein